MKVLLVGAGAVGVGYGRHLQLGGAEVSFFVREKYRAECEAGFTVYPLNGLLRRGRRARSVRFEGCEVLTTTDEVARQRWDQVWLCISATALRGEWLAPFLAAIGDATVVLLQPGLEDHAYLAERCPADRIVRGMITLVSYQAPLPGEERAPGIAYWLPPLSPVPFSGDPARTRAVVGALRAGGCPAKVDPDVARTAGFGSSILMGLLVALEARGWSFRARRSPDLGLAVAAARQAMDIVASYLGGGRPPLALRLVARRFPLALALRFAPWLTPLPLETFFRYHFTKTGDQTRFSMQTYIAQGRARGLPVDRLEALCGLLPPAPAEAEPTSVAELSAAR